MGDLVRAGLAISFVLGAIVGGLTAKRFRLLYPDLTGLGRRLAGGALMGIGAALIPGGNDRLVLVDVPSLHVHGILAYGAMAAAILLGLEIKRWAPKTAHWNRSHR
jgi:hypothetical protein